MNMVARIVFGVGSFGLGALISCNPHKSNQATAQDYSYHVLPIYVCSDDSKDPAQTLTVKANAQTLLMTVTSAEGSWTGYAVKNETDRRVSMTLITSNSHAFAITKVLGSIPAYTLTAGDKSMPCLPES